MSAIVNLLINLGILAICMALHEFAHGWTANRLGDDTAKRMGRLTLNPLAHIDPIGTVALPIILYFLTSGRFVFGAAKPVPINFLALKNPRRDIMLVGFSGPLANILSAVLAAVLFHITKAPVLIIFIGISLSLGIFNLIPLPPLDGSRIVAGILPPQLASKYMRIEPFGFIILLILLQFGPVNRVIWSVADAAFKLLVSPF